MVTKKKVKKKVSQSDSLDFGQGVKVRLEVGISLAIGSQSSKYTNFYSSKPALTLDAAPNRKQVKAALVAMQEIIDEHNVPRINRALRQLERRK